MHKTAKKIPTSFMDGPQAFCTELTSMKIENINTGVSREIIFQNQFILAIQFTFCLQTFILDYWEKTWTKNQQLFDGIVGVTLFDGVEGVD